MNKSIGVNGSSINIRGVHWFSSFSGYSFLVFSVDSWFIGFLVIRVDIFFEAKPKIEQKFAEFKLCQIEPLTELHYHCSLFVFKMSSRGFSFLLLFQGHPNFSFMTSMAGSSSFVRTQLNQGIKEASLDCKLIIRLGGVITFHS